MEKFIQEVQCQAKLKHTAVLFLVGFSFPVGGTGDFAVFTEFMPNKSLKHVIEEASKGTAPTNWETIRAINIFGIAAGMAYVHQQGIIHRDLKTENIMLDENYCPKIADFGFSKLFEEGTQDIINQTVGIGTPIYMAPEIFEDQHYSNKIDVFAYAIILYELTTLNKPWSHKKVTVYSLPTLIKNGERPSIKDNELSDDYLELIHRCWDIDPKVRPSFIKIVKGFMDYREVYFDHPLIEKETLDDYIEKATEKLDFSLVED